jgi:hypothetical protein
MPLGNWREVILIGPYAVKIPRNERSDAARCLNRWELEMWTVWRQEFGWPHLCPVVWGDPDGHILVMQRAKQDVTFDEIRAFEDAWLDSQLAHLPSAEPKPEDWGHLADGRLVVCDYGYACDNEAEILRQREEYTAALRRMGRPR